MLLNNTEYIPSYAWLLFAFLTCVHLFANYKAVRSLNIPILNAQRFNLLMKTYLKSSGRRIEPPLLVNAKESVFLATGMTGGHNFLLPRFIFNSEYFPLKVQYIVQIKKLFMTLYILLTVNQKNIIVVI